MNFILKSHIEKNIAKIDEIKKQKIVIEKKHKNLTKKKKKQN